MDPEVHTQSAESFLPARSRKRDLFELAVGYGLILVTCWSPNPPQRTLFWIAFGWVAAVSIAAREDWKQMGFGLSGSLRSLWVLAAALGMSGLALWMSAHLHTLHGLHEHAPWWSHLWGYLIWALLQQFILQDFVLLRLLRLTPSRRRAVGTAAALFAVAHLPNPLLTILTLAWGALACLLFLRYRGLFTLGLVHAVLGICVAAAVPNAVHHHMRVGLGYLTYQPHHVRLRKRVGESAERRPAKAGQGKSQSAHPESLSVFAVATS